MTNQKNKSLDEKVEEPAKEFIKSLKEELPDLSDEKLQRAEEQIRKIKP